MDFIHLLNGKQFSLVALVAFLAPRGATGLLLFRFRHLRTVRGRWLGGVGGIG